MQGNDALLEPGLTTAGAVASHLRERLTEFLSPLLLSLDAQVDRRLVRTLRATVEAILLFRNRPHGLVLSELGAVLAGPARAPAGTKRLSNLLRSSKWSHTLLSAFLWKMAHDRQEELRHEGQEALLAWDESVQEKPESQKAEGLCAVKSSKAHRLSRIKPGFYNPPSKPIFVPGLHWLCLLLMGRGGPPTVALMRWWTTRGELATDAFTVRLDVLRQCAKDFGGGVLHLFDRGYAGRPWLFSALSLHLRFVVRFPKRYRLVDEKGERPAWQIARGKRAWDTQEVRDAHTRKTHRVAVLAFPVHHSNLGPPLWLVVARHGRHKEPWYLLTTEPVRTVSDCWRIVFAYARRWQIEMAFRYTKSELAMESPRLWTFERRLKLLLIVTLAYAFLLLLLLENLAPLRLWLLRHFCHRNGKRGRETPTPLYRLRSALSRLWSTYPYDPSTGNSG